MSCDSDSDCGYISEGMMLTVYIYAVCFGMVATHVSQTNIFAALYRPMEKVVVIA